MSLNIFFKLLRRQSCISDVELFITAEADLEKNIRFMDSSENI